MKTNLEKTIDYTLYLLIVSGIISIILFLLNIVFFLRLIFIMLSFLSLIALIFQIYLLSVDIESLLIFSKKTSKKKSKETVKEFDHIKNNEAINERQIDITDFHEGFSEDETPFDQHIDMNASLENLQISNQSDLLIVKLDQQTIEKIKKKLKGYRIFLVFSIFYIFLLSGLVFFFDILRIVLIIVITIYVFMAIDIIKKIQSMKKTILFKQ